MLRAVTAFGAVLLLAASAEAIFTFNNNNNDNMVFSNDFLSVTRVKCFGAVISEHNEDDRETEFDVCLFGVVGGLIVLIGLYPALIQSGAPTDYHRRRHYQLQQQPEFRNPYADQQPAFSAPKPSVSQRFSKFFGGIAQKFQSQTQKLSEQVQERLGNAEASLYDLQQQVAPAKAPVAQEQQAAKEATPQ